MSFMDRIKVPSNEKPVIATILGEAGVGKSSLAAAFPKCLFLKIEDGTDRVTKSLQGSFKEIEVGGVEDFWQVMDWLASGQYGCKTVVIDSVTKLESWFQEDVIASDTKRPKSIATAHGGYGKGFQMVAEMHRKVKRKADALNKIGMNVLFIAHVDIETMDLPDQDPYSRFGLRLNKKSISPYVDDVSAVMLVRQETFVMKDDGERRGKAMSSNDRVITMHASPASVTKNGWGVTDNVAFPEGSNPLSEIIPSLKTNS